MIIDDEIRALPPKASPTVVERQVRAAGAKGLPQMIGRESLSERTGLVDPVEFSALFSMDLGNQRADKQFYTHSMIIWIVNRERFDV